MRGIRENSNGRRAFINCSRVGFVFTGTSRGKGYDFFLVMEFAFSRAAYQEANGQYRCSQSRSVQKGIVTNRGGLSHRSDGGGGIGCAGAGIGSA